MSEGTALQRLVHPDDAEQMLEQLDRIEREAEPPYELSLQFGDGELPLVREELSTLADERHRRGTRDGD